MSGGLSIVIAAHDSEFALPAAVAAALAGVAAARAAGFAAETVVVAAGSREGSAVLLRQLEALYWDAGLRVCSPGWQGSGRYVLLAPIEHVLVGANVPTLLRAAVETRAAVVYGNVLHPDGSVSGNESVQPRVFRAGYLPRVLLVDREQIEPEGDVAMTALCRGLAVVFVPVVLAFGPSPPEPVPTTEPAVRERWPLASRHRRYHPGVGEL